jgi:preprotein translocase subunit SecA
MEAEREVFAAAASFGGQTGSAAASGSFAAATATGAGAASGGQPAPTRSRVEKATNLPSAPAMRQMQEQLGDRALARPPATDGRPAGVAKVGRNDPCWCGSGLKYKKCHGR